MQLVMCFACFSSSACVLLSSLLRVMLMMGRAFRTMLWQVDVDVDVDDDARRFF